MTSFNPVWGGLDYFFNSPPGDPFEISYTPSIAGDSIASIDQLISEESVQSFMQAQFREATMNLAGFGLIAEGIA